MQVEKRDVTEAFRLLEVAMQQSATDHATGMFSNQTEVQVLDPLFYHLNQISQVSINHYAIQGTIDMDLITTGVSASERMRRESLLSATRNLIMEKMQIGGPSMRLLEVYMFFKLRIQNAKPLI